MLDEKYSLTSDNEPSIPSNQIIADIKHKTEAVTEQIENVEQEVKEITQNVDDGLAARITILDKHREIPSAPIHLLDQLERNRSDKTRMSSFASISLGAAIGIGTNWLTDGTMNNAGKVAIGLLALQCHLAK